MTSTTITPVVIGTRLHCILYGGREGTVYAIHGEQRPDTIRSLCGIGYSGGSATFDVVFDDGSISNRLPEAIIHGVQWTIFDDVWGANRIAAALAYAEEVTANKTAAAAAEKAAFAAEVARLKEAPEWAHLTQGNGERDGRLAAANVRAVLKKSFPGIKFSVRKQHHSSIGVSWEDGPTVAQVEDVVSAFKGGRFDSMQDLASFETSPFISIFGGVQYLSTRREESDALIERAITQVFTDYAGNLKDTPRPAVEDYRRGRLWSVPVPLIQDDLQSLIRTAAYQLVG
ncbi:hypothetical protein SAMN02982917_1987 [Azospirillum oryzae]|uniref:Large polyvalent protein associated domain-containing protein n=1 Tax=Azospirillum oryzae TaxID=286727 RepID=A0A1X7ESK1_9PROT|nr:LPD29 domain-containing protein [Azospirillum oryzae]SMF39405.1 hypothetical protein SAMN02982917_1987 [Azospirillum oryzae]